MIQAVQPFAFDRVFAPSPSVVSGPDAASLEAEVARLRDTLDVEIERARTKGFEAGLAQARAEQSAALLAATDALQASLELLDERFAQAEEQLATEAAALALAAADHLAGHAANLEPTAAIDEAIGRTLDQVRRGTPVHVRVHPDLAPAIEDVIAERQSRDRRKLHLLVVSDTTIPTGDARLVWEDGSLLCSAEARRDALLCELRQLFPDLEARQYLPGSRKEHPPKPL